MDVDGHRLGWVCWNKLGIYVFEAIPKITKHYLDRVPIIQGLPTQQEIPIVIDVLKAQPRPACQADHWPRLDEHLPSTRHLDFHVHGADVNR